MNLYPHQVEAVRFLKSRGRAGLFDEMGLGKTATALSALPDRAAAVVVCPKIAKNVWLDEAKRWRPDLTAEALSGRGSFRWPRRGELLVINYDVLPFYYGGLVSPVNVVADEAHYLKSWTSRRSRAFRRLAAEAVGRGGSAWLLTGTPLLRDPYDLWCVLGSVDLAERAFGPFQTYMQLCGAKTRSVKIRGGTRRVLEWGRPSPLAREMLRQVSLRRTRKDVALSLPQKTRQRVVVDCLSPDNLRALDAFSRDLTSSGMGLDQAVEQAVKERSTAFEEISKTRRAVAALKTQAAFELLDAYRDAGRKVVLFSAHRIPVELAGARRGWASVTGDVRGGDRDRIVDRFQRGQLEGVALTIGAGGTAITLTAASDVVFVDQDWTPALNLQAEDRVCRIGQTLPVQVVCVEANHPLEQAVGRVLRRKVETAEALL